MVAHSLGHTYLYDCELTGTVALNTHNSMSPEYSYIHMFGGRLNSSKASILCAEDGKAIMNLDHVAIGDIADGNLAYAHSGGRLVANLAEMTVSGNLDREEKSYLEINLKETTLTGSANATALSLDAASTWNVTEDSRIAVLSVAPGAVIAADHPVTVTYGALEGALPAAENVTFVQDDQVKDDFEAKMMMPPPGGPGGPGMPPPPPPMD